MAYPGVYRAKAARVDGNRLTAYVPQIFGEEPVMIVDFVGGPPTAADMGWVSFHGGHPEFPVWLGAGIGGGGGGTVSDVVWVGANAPADPQMELWWDTDEELPAGGAGGSEEIYVGTSDPGAGYELWYDTDADAPLTIDQRWNTAWGVISATRFNTQVTAGINSVLADTGVSATWAAVGGRQYRVSVLCTRVFMTVGSMLDVTWTDGANVVQDYMLINHVPNGQTQVDGWIYTYPAISTSMTLKLRAASTTANAALFQYGTYPSFITVEDVGPLSAVPAPPPPDWTMYDARFVNVEELAPAWTSLTLLSTWTQRSGYETARYRKVGDTVQIRGTVNFGAGGANPMARLPSGYRPALTVRQNTGWTRTSDSAQLPLAIEIATSGDIGISGLSAAGYHDINMEFPV